MKKTLFFATAAMMTLAACNSRPTDSYIIKGEVEGLPDSTVIVLSPISHTPEDNLTEAVVIDGKFTIEGKADEPRAVWMRVKDSRGLYPMMVENGEIIISAKGVNKSDNDTVQMYQLEDVVVTGSPMSDKFKELYSRRDSLNNMYAEIYEKYRDVTAAVAKARGEGNKAMMDSVLATEDYKNFEAAEKNFFNAVETTTKNLINENKDTFWGPLMMIVNYSYLTPEQRPVFESFSEEAQNSYYGQKVREEIYPVGKVGDEMKDFSIDGKSLAELCKGNKVVILDFWASWCRPCRAEIPNLKEIYNKHHDKGFEIISVSIDNDEAAWKKALEQEQLPWINFRDADDAVSKLYKVSAVPTMYILDGDHKLVAENLRGEELAKKIDELMAE